MLTAAFSCGSALFNMDFKAEVADAIFFLSCDTQNSTYNAEVPKSNTLLDKLEMKGLSQSLIFKHAKTTGISYGQEEKKDVSAWEFSFLNMETIRWKK